MEVAAQRDKFNCQKCRFHRHCDDSNPAPFPMFAVPEIGLESRTCLLPMITPLSHRLMRLYGHYKNHLLPFAGGVTSGTSILRGNNGAVAVDPVAPP